MPSLYSARGVSVECTARYSKQNDLGAPRGRLKHDYAATSVRANRVSHSRMIRHILSRLPLLVLLTIHGGGGFFSD